LIFFSVCDNNFAIFFVWKFNENTRIKSDQDNTALRTNLNWVTQQACLEALLVRERYSNKDL
jgi:hypothetical protein